MSVLVEALSLIIPRRVLDLSWPGGTDAFREALLAEHLPVRRQCADDQLVSVMVLEMEQAEVVAALLRERGVVQQDEAQRFVEYAVVDQRVGPVLPCPWLSWSHHPDGFTYAWLAGSEPGDMAVPADWEPEQSRRLVRSDLRDEPQRMFPLAAENGFETWLDTTTGRVHHALAQRDRAGASGTTVPETSSASGQEAVGSGQKDVAAGQSNAGHSGADAEEEKDAKRARGREQAHREVERILRECGLEPDENEDGRTDDNADEVLEAHGVDLDAIIAELEADIRRDRENDRQNHEQRHQQRGGADVSDATDAGREDRAGREEDEPWRSCQADAVPVIPHLWPVVIEALAERGWRYETRDGTAALCRVRGDAANYEVFLSTDEQPELVWCWVTIPVRVPADRRGALCELLNAATQRFVSFGHVTMDPARGDVHWRHGIDVEGGLLGSLMVNNMINAGLAVCDQVFPAIMAVAFGGVSPNAALARMEA